MPSSRKNLLTSLYLDNIKWTLVRSSRHFVAVPLLRVSIISTVLACMVGVASSACPSPPDCYVCSSSRAICKLCPEHPDIPATITDLKIISGGCSVLTQMGLLKTTSFSRYTSLQSLSMDHTNVKILYGAVFEKNVNLKTLSLAQNAIRSFTSVTFKGLTQLKSLNLAQSKITSLNSASFSPLTNLETLNLQGNLITDLTARAFDGLGNLVTLSLSDNPVAIIELDTLKPLTNVQEINMKGTELTAIPSRLFAGLASLRRVDASGGKIRVVADDSLFGTHLDLLDLSSNRLSAAPYAAIKNAATPPKEIDLSQNRIVRIFAHDFRNVSTRVLGLQSNPIRLIEAGAFSGSSITELNLSNTSLTSLPASMEAWLTGQKVSISLQENKAWLCSCFQLWLARYLQASTTSRSPTCSTSTKYAGRTLAAVAAQLEVDCKTTTSTSTTTTTTTTTTATTTTTTTPATTSSTPASSSAKSATAPTTKSSHHPASITRASGPPHLHTSSPATFISRSPNSQTNSHTTTGGTGSNNNNNKSTNKGNMNVMTTKPHSNNPKANANPTVKSNPSVNPGSTTNGVTADPGQSASGNGRSPGPTDPGSNSGSIQTVRTEGTVNLMAVLLAVLVTLAACLFFVGVVAACLSCHRQKKRRGRVEDSRANQVAQALAALSGKWHQQM
ncbi:leucine-rich repeat-containing protein 4b [Plakobranchus ocellatus]|uniref:Leucine-rich repeat-containing protein 4b n=1 Tax=Plakobranchus ocellatus TaxID=259542 RepID=A0AAV3Z028_9GAST|nr:leucine-rich repeat-containing protein 4b [Plakobranchus ocellatus]